MDKFFYDNDIENERRISVIGESINNSLLNERVKKSSYCDNSYNCIICILSGTLVTIVIIGLIFVLKNI